jgi:hypothetical protein
MTCATLYAGHRKDTMSTDLKEQLAAAVADLGLVIKPICEVQRLYNEHKKYLSGKVLKNPLEEVHLLDENFPYWIKLENDDPSRPGTWIGSKASIVVPKLETGEFDDKGFTFDESRAKALLNLPTLIRNPNCIHVNLRHADRGQGGIQGRHVYVEYYGGKKRKVAFTTHNEVLNVNVLVTSFWTYPKWVSDCAQSPAVYVRPGSVCTCCKQKSHP